MTRQDEPAEAAAGNAAALSTVVRLSTGTPFDGAGLMRFFADHAVPGLESGGAGHYARAVRLPHGNGTVEITLGGPDDGDPGDGTQDDGTPGGQAMLLCTARVDNAGDLDVLLARVRRLFDLDADSEAIDAALGRDPGLSAAVAARPGIRLPGSLDAEETLFRTLIGQQISVKAARTVLGRITAELGEGDAAAGTRLFPTAATLAEHGRDVLRGPASRIAAIVGVAEALASGALRIDATVPVEELTANLRRTARCWPLDGRLPRDAGARESGCAAHDRSRDAAERGSAWSARHRPRPRRARSPLGTVAQLRRTAAVAVGQVSLA